MRTINDKLARTISKPGLYRADTSLYLLVKESGRRSWVQRIMVKGRRYNLGLGPYPVVTLEEAKIAALENRRKAYRGESLLAEKLEATMPTFEQAALKYHSKQTWKPARAKVFLQVMAKHVFPAIGNRPLDTIRQKDVIDVFSPVWTTKPHTAKRVRQFVRQVFSYCQANEYIAANPAGDAIEAALPRSNGTKKNYRALDYKEMPEAVRTINAGVTTPASRLCLLFTIFTGVRGGEARAAVWSEIDFEARAWNIPGDKMKSGKAHRVRLSAPCLDILEQAKPLNNASGLIFPSPYHPGKPLTPEGLNKNLSNIGLADKTVVHGFRSSFRTWAGEENETPREVIEAALAHTVQGVEGAYMRGELFEKRRALMQSWADYITGQGE